MMNFVLTDNKYTLASTRLEENMEWNTKKEKIGQSFHFFFF